MAVVYNPITLPASKMIATMTSLIGEVRFNDTLKPSDIVNELVDSSRVGKVEYGKGIVYTFKLDTQPVKDLSETSSVTKITKPQLAQETIEIDNYKFVPISVSEILTRDAVLNGNAIDTFFSFVMSLLEDTAQFHLFDEVNELYQSWTPGKATQTIQVDQIDVSDLTGLERNEALKWNATEIAKVMRKTMNNMKIKNAKYTDKDTYVDSNDGQTKSVISALTGRDMKLVFNDNYYTNFLADAMASLYHSDEVGKMIPNGQKIVLPEDAMDEDNKNVIAWLSHKDKFALADFYAVTLAFKDASTTYTNTFYHFAYGVGVFKYAPGVRFVANVVQTV